MALEEYIKLTEGANCHQGDRLEVKLDFFGRRKIIHFYRGEDEIASYRIPKRWSLNPTQNAELLKLSQTLVPNTQRCACDKYSAYAIAFDPDKKTEVAIIISSQIRTKTEFGLEKLSSFANIYDSVRHNPEIVLVDNGHKTFSRMEHNGEYDIGTLVQDPDYPGGYVRQFIIAGELIIPFLRNNCKLVEPTIRKFEGVDLMKSERSYYLILDVNNIVLKLNELQHKDASSNYNKNK